MSRVELEVELPGGVTGVIFIGTRDDPRVLAEDFARAYSLGAAAVGPLSHCILEKQRKLVDSVRISRQAEREQRAAHQQGPAPTPTSTPAITRMAKDLQRVSPKRRFEQLSSMGAGKLRALAPPKHTQGHQGHQGHHSATPRAVAGGRGLAAHRSLDDLKSALLHHDAMEASSDPGMPFRGRGELRRRSLSSRDNSRGSRQSQSRSRTPTISMNSTSVKAGNRLYDRALVTRTKKLQMKRIQEESDAAQFAAEFTFKPELTSREVRNKLPVHFIRKKQQHTPRDLLEYEEFCTPVPHVPQARRLHKTHGSPDVYTALHGDAEAREERRRISEHAAESAAMQGLPSQPATGSRRSTPTSTPHQPRAVPKPGFLLETHAGRVFDRLSRTSRTLPAPRHDTMGLTERELLHAEWHARKVVDVGQHMACAVLSNGRVAWWGRTAGSTVPQSADTHIAAVSCGYSHVLALQTDGSVIGWGISQRGEAPSEPHRPAGMRATAISAGCGWSAAVLQDGSVHCWGATDHGQDRTPVLSKSSGRYAVAVSAGFGHALAVLNTGEVVGWGLDTDAFGKVRHSQATPPPMPAGKRVVAAAAGGFFSAVLLHDGTVVCWGCNDDGQCDPKSAAQTRQVVALSASLVSCMALTATGAITSWGRGGPYDHTSVPGSGAWLPDLGIEGFSSIGGSAKEFGRQRAAAVAAGNMFSVAALADGTLIAWGDDADGRAQAPCPDTLGALRVPVKPCPS